MSKIYVSQSLFNKTIEHFLHIDTPYFCVRCIYSNVAFVRLEGVVNNLAEIANTLHEI